MKKILFAITASTFFVSMNAYADEFSGAYIGLSVGYGKHELRNKNVKFKKDEVDHQLEENAKVAGFVFGGHLGYGQQFDNKVYLGGELSTHYNGGTKKLKAGEVDVKVKYDATFELAMRLGMVFENVMPYVRLGIASQNVKIEPKDLKKISKRHFAFVPGLGIEVDCGNRFKVRAEILHSMGQPKFGDFEGKKVKTQQSKFLIGGSYYF